MFHDDADEAPRDVVRSFMVTGLRTRPSIEELSLESMLSLADGVPAVPDTRLTTEQRALLELVVTPMSVAEVSAHLELPLRSALVVASDLIEIGLVERAAETNEMTIELLDQIRVALEAL